MTNPDIIPISAGAGGGMNGHSILPKRGRGRLSAAGQAQYDEDLRQFLDLMVEIQSRLDFKMSSRGWCYGLEPYGLLKTDFDAAQRIINDCRQKGMLPCGFMAEDKARSFSCIEDGVSGYTDPDEKAKWILDQIPSMYRGWKPYSFHDDQDYYVQMLVEKIDLVTLFEPVCGNYNVPLSNARGWSSIGQREELILRFKDYEEQGKGCVLLYCGDFDPAGLRISDFINENFNSLEPATGWCADDLIIDRFGLNGDFINENGLTWIDNLETGGTTGLPLNDPRHPDHNKPYVKEYLAKWGARKCEANAIVVKPDLGRELCETAINRYIPADSLKSYEGSIRDNQDRLRVSIKTRVQDGYLDNLFK